jgi:hypothetical protein
MPHCLGGNCEHVNATCRMADVTTGMTATATAVPAAMKTLQGVFESI